MRLQDRVAIVTGGGKGIGKHYAQALAAEGASIVIAEIDGPAAEATAAELKAEALAVPTDVADETSVKAMVERSVATFGRIDILVNNAAIFASVAFKRGPHDQITVEDWDRMFAVNVRGMWLCCREVTPHMRQKGYGKIINISSGTALNGTPNMLHYVASKAAVLGLSRALAREVGAFGICVNSIAPGLVESETYLPQMTPERREQAARDRILQRAQTPDDLVGTVVFLASSDSDFITGQTINVNGGSALS